ncbi:MAG: hypothetical protein RIM23_25315 [Coleofasciculus sp. G3-WIS-01]|uniref:hypothetical protein n=1 Tax=Coleofasciculus sp. G3-WIS-01 TaxID=3069528 RepID=UPI0032F123C7
MGIENRRWKGLFAPTEVVELKQMCLTPGQIFQPGRYKAEDLPDIAFEMGLVEGISKAEEEKDKTGDIDK